MYNGHPRGQRLDLEREIKSMVFWGATSVLRKSFSVRQSAL